MKLESPRLTFHRPTEADRDFWRHYLADPERARFLVLGRPFTRSEADAYVERRLAHFERRGFGTFLLTLGSAGERVGYAGLEYVRDTEVVDIRYGLLQAHWGRGLALEAARRIVRAGFEDWGLGEIYGAVVPENRASAAILRKLGMEPTDEIDVHGAAVDYYVMRRPVGSNASTAKDSP